MVNYQESNLLFGQAKATLLIGSKFLFVNHKKEVVVFEVEKECSRRDKEKGFEFDCVQVSIKKYNFNTNERRSFSFLEQFYKSSILSDGDTSLVDGSWSLLLLRLAPDLDTLEISSIQNPATPFYCSKCNYTTTTKSNYSKHLKTEKHNCPIGNNYY